ncbi:MAG TPA: MFS transporter [Candidatus Limnocylindria bacterium]|nr:MFS transporter [Candidatus Limnocylindria bacterium]
MAPPPAEAALSTTTVAAPRREAFAALGHPEFRAYFGTALVAMIADNVEHVITYWLIYERFHSPALAGFAVISHWAPFLILGVGFGALADRYDCRRIMQAGHGLLMVVSFAWAILFMTDTLETWHAVVLLILHGTAGALSAPASQLFLYDVVGRDDLHSAVRLNATARNLAILFGPGVGSALLLGLGPAYGLLANCLLSLPLIVWLFRTPYTGHVHHGAARAAPSLSLADAYRTFGEVARHPVILSMVVLVGAMAFLVGNAFQAQMPAFAEDLRAPAGPLGYGLLLAASAAGSIVGAFLLEVWRPLRQPTVRRAIGMGIAWALAVVVFSLTSTYAVALAALFAVGFLALGYGSQAQTIVQLEAPPERRGRFVGLFSMAASGMRIGSGVTVGLAGAAIGIHASLGLSAIAALAVAVALLLLVRSPRVAFG